MNHKTKCAHCRRLFRPDPRVKNQKYCGQKNCQLARKRKWRQEKMANDPDYQANHKDSQQKWRQQHPDYWKRYRNQHPQYVRRNRQLQKRRNAKRGSGHMIAKCDASQASSIIISGTYYILPEQHEGIAKIDSLAQKVYLIPVAYG